MAITIEQEPVTNLCLSGNPILWTFSSNFTAQSNFSYIVEVYVDNILHSTHEVFPENGIYGKFDVSSIAESELTAPLIPTTINVIEAGEILIGINVIEKYGLTPTTHDSHRTTDAHAIKGKLFSSDWVNFDTNDYVIEYGAYGRKFLTSAPIFNLSEGELLNLYMTSLENGDSIEIELTYKDANGSVLNTESILETIFPFNTFSLSWDILDSYYSLDGVSTVDCYLDLASGAGSTETITINIDHCTCPLESTRLHFLSQLGSIDAFSFKRLSRKSMSVQAQSYTTNQGEWNGSGYIYTNQNSQIGNFQTLSESKLKIESGWVDEATQSWLNDNLFTSPYILMETPNGLRRVANMSNSVEYKKVLNDMLFNVTIEIELDTHSSMIV